ncbi:MAG: CPBP family intramembrane metalloprotease [Verrucomicrobia bacterium]|nr:CPBP family intramembrane metalloprotease [Verrucomicrobiota bacterium]
MSANTSPSTAPPLESSNSGVAPMWHTAILLVWLLGISFIGAHTDLSNGHVPTYLIVILVEWAMVAFIWWGLSRCGIRLSELIGGSWARPLHFLRDLGLGIAFMLLIGFGLLQLISALLNPESPKSLTAMMPQTWFEVVLWVLMSVTAGFCEEVIFRGYLLRQFTALTRSLAGGIVLQALLFGLSHGYQGWKLMLLIWIYGVCFGLFARWRKSLRPGMLAHALEDSVGGVLGFLANAR